MKILVIDDNSANRESAVQFLGTYHDLTVVGTYDEALKLIIKQVPYWDVVLCDLMMPAGGRAQGDKTKYADKEMIIGWALAIDATLAGAKYVAVVTDINHHDHPASALLDRMAYEVFDLNGARALFTNVVEKIDVNGIKGKNWAEILEILLEGKRKLKGKTL